MSERPKFAQTGDRTYTVTPEGKKDRLSQAGAEAMARDIFGIEPEAPVPPEAINNMIEGGADRHFDRVEKVYDAYEPTGSLSTVDRAAQSATAERQRREAEAERQSDRDELAKLIEATRNSPQVSELNEQARLAVWGSGNSTYTDAEGNVASPDQPYEGILAQIRSDRNFGSSVKERHEFADKYEKDILDLVNHNDLELCQAKLVMDLRLGDRESMNALVENLMKQEQPGGRPKLSVHEAHQIAEDRYHQLDEQRLKLIKERGIFSHQAYSEHLARANNWGDRAARQDRVRQEHGAGETGLKPDDANKRDSALEGLDDEVDKARGEKREREMSKEARETWELIASISEKDWYAMRGGYDKRRDMAKEALGDSDMAKVAMDTNGRVIGTEEIEKYIKESGREEEFDSNKRELIFGILRNYRGAFEILIGAVHGGSKAGEKPGKEPVATLPPPEPLPGGSDLPPRSPNDPAVVGVGPVDPSTGQPAGATVKREEVKETTREKNRRGIGAYLLGAAALATAVVAMFFPRGHDHNNNPVPPTLGEPTPKAHLSGAELGTFNSDEGQKRAHQIMQGVQRVEINGTHWLQFRGTNGKIVKIPDFRKGNAAFADSTLAALHQAGAETDTIPAYVGDDERPYVAPVVTAPNIDQSLTPESSQNPQSNGPDGEPQAQSQQ